MVNVSQRSKGNHLRIAIPCPGCHVYPSYLSCQVLTITELKPKSCRRKAGKKSYPFLITGPSNHGSCLNFPAGRRQKSFNHQYELNCSLLNVAKCLTISMIGTWFNQGRVSRVAEMSQRLQAVSDIVGSDGWSTCLRGVALGSSQSIGNISLF